jgi:hypothetical protein
VYKRSGSPVNGYLFFVVGSNSHYSGAPRRFFYQVIGSTGPFIPANSIIPLGEWKPVAMVHDAETQVASIHINGELDATRSNVRIPSLDNPVDRGDEAGAGGGFQFDGGFAMDEPCWMPHAGFRSTHPTP